MDTATPYRASNSTQYVSVQCACGALAQHIPTPQGSVSLTTPCTCTGTNVHVRYTSESRVVRKRCEKPPVPPHMAWTKLNKRKWQ